MIVRRLPLLLALGMYSSLVHAQALFPTVILVDAAPTVGAVCTPGEQARLASDTGGFYVCTGGVWTLPSGAAASGSGATFGPSDGANWFIGSDYIGFTGSLPSRPGVSSAGGMYIDADDDASGASHQFIVLDADAATGTANSGVPFTATTCTLQSELLMKDTTVDGFACFDRAGKGALAGAWGQVLWGSGNAGDAYDTGDELCALFNFTVCYDCNKDTGSAISSSTCTTDQGTDRFFCYCGY